MKHIKLCRIKIHRVENKTQVTIVFKVPFQNKSLFCQTLQQVLVLQRSQIYFKGTMTEYKF